MDELERKNFIPTEFVESETQWFYKELGIDDMYFSTETVEA
jgi:glutamate dehydrogenase